MENIKDFLKRHNFDCTIKYDENDNDDKRLHLYILDYKNSSLLHIICNVFADYIYTYNEYGNVIDSKTIGNTIFLYYYYLTFDYILFEIESELFYMIITMFKKNVKKIELKLGTIMNFIKKKSGQSCFLCTCHQIGFHYITKKVPNDFDSEKMCLICHTKDSENCTFYLTHYKMIANMDEIYPLLCKKIKNINI